jgi:hypothetical protein
MCGGGGLDGPVPRRRICEERHRVQSHMSTRQLHRDENGKKLACLVLSYATDKGARRTNGLPVRADYYLRAICISMDLSPMLKKSIASAISRSLGSRIFSPGTQVFAAIAVSSSQDLYVKNHRQVNVSQDCC